MMVGKSLPRSVWVKPSGTESLGFRVYVPQDPFLTEADPCAT